MVSILQGVLTTIILIGAGILIGGFWGEWEGIQLSQTATPIPAPRTLADRIKVEVLNGSGEPGLAQEVSEELRDAGFDVVAVGNADHFDHERTHVLDRSGRPGAAAEVAEGLPADSIVVALDRDLYLDATIVLGRDRVRSDNQD